jgi:hypothetical protein
MPGLVPGIHVLAHWWEVKTWMAGTSPAMTNCLRALRCNCHVRRGNPRNFFATFIDRKFTTSIEQPFTKVFDAIAPLCAAACLYRARNAD